MDAATDGRLHHPCQPTSSPVPHLPLRKTWQSLMTPDPRVPLPSLLYHLERNELKRQAKSVDVNSDPRAHL